VFRRREASPAAFRQLPFFDREYHTLPHLDVPYDADAADLVGKFYIVAARFDTGNSQALVVVNRSIPIVLALVVTPAVFSRWRHLKTRNRVQRGFQNRMPLRSWATTEEPTSPNKIEANNAQRIPASRTWRKRVPLLAQSRSILYALSKFLAGVKFGWLNKRQK
jgi:hypothetical protein